MLAPRAPAWADDYDAPIVGSWYALLAMPSQPPKSALATFIPGGALVQTSTNHPTTSAAHGAWEQVGKRDYLVLFRSFRFDDTGMLVATVTSGALLTLTDAGTEYSGRR